jgi:hypothetical protein
MAITHQKHITTHQTTHTNHQTHNTAHHKAQNNAHKLNRYRLHVTFSLSLSFKQTLDKIYSFKNQSLDQKPSAKWFLQTIKKLVHIKFPRIKVF